MYVWWPGITKDIERTVQQCSACQLHQSTPSVAPLHPWSWPTRPWARLHLDYAGPVQGKMILVMVDAHSKWIEAICTPNATSTAVIEELRTIFAQFGIPETVVTEYGTRFVSAEIKAFFWYQASNLSTLIFQILSFHHLHQTTSANTESSTASPASETMPTENTNSEPASPNSIPTNPDATRVNPTSEKSYPKHNCVPVERFEPTWT